MDALQTMLEEKMFANNVGEFVCLYKILVGKLLFLPPGTEYLEQKKAELL